MVLLTQGEIIQIFRKRAGMNQGQLGAAAFHTTLDSGRTKIKNIELNKQKPTLDDLKAIAGTLGVSLGDLLFFQEEPMNSPAQATSEDMMVYRKVFDHFPGLKECLGILGKAIVLDDEELITYVAKKAAGILLQDAKAGDNLQTLKK